MGEEQLAGGVANAGRVTRRGEYVLRPPGPYSPSIQRLLRSVHEAGFTGVPVPAGSAADGRERLVFIPGEVPLPPYPLWAQSDAALASVAVLMRRFHRASAAFGQAGTVWSAELADPAGGGPTVCHNDVCLENVVFRDGAAVALLDFDFAAPGRPVYDLARFAQLCVPVDDDISAARAGWQPADKAARLRLVADAYGLDAALRSQLLAIVSELVARGGQFVRARVAAGDPNFTRMWQEMGGAERFNRRRRWWAQQRTTFTRALR